MVCVWGVGGVYIYVYSLLSENKNFIHGYFPCKFYIILFYFSKTGLSQKA